MSLTEKQIRALHRAGLPLGQALRTLAALGVDLDTGVATGTQQPLNILTVDTPLSLDDSDDGGDTRVQSRFTQTLEVGTYLIVAHLICESLGGSGNVQFGLDFTGTAPLFRTDAFISGVGAQTEAPDLTFTGDTIPQNEQRCYEMHGLLEVTTPGDLQLKLSYLVSIGTMLLKAGSYLQAIPAQPV